MFARKHHVISPHYVYNARYPRLWYALWAADGLAGQRLVSWCAKTNRRKHVTQSEANYISERNSPHILTDLLRCPPIQKKVTFISTKLMQQNDIGLCQSWIHIHIRPVWPNGDLEPNHSSDCIGNISGAPRVNFIAVGLKEDELIRSWQP